MRREAVQFRRALVLVMGTLVVPGSAQLLAGNRRVGGWALAAWVSLAVTVGLTAWLVPLDTLLRLAVRPSVLTTFQVLVFGVVVGWGALLLDAWRLGRPPSLARRHRVVVAVLTLGLCAALAYPAVTAVRYAAAARDAVVALFPSGRAAATSGGRVNVLLLGADAGEGRVGLRPDSIHLVSVDARTARPVMFSLPRNLERARFPEDTPAGEVFPRGFTGEGDEEDFLLNATWTYGEDNPDLFPGPAGPGATAVKQAVEGTLGLPVHYYVLVDLAGFQSLVDALGGVTLTIPERIPIGQQGRVLEPGERRLDGYETLWFARSREGSSDYARMARQRCVVDAVLREADPATVLRNFTELAATATSLLETDVPQAQVGELLDLALRAKSQELTSVQFVPPLVSPADPDVDLIRETVRDAVSASVRPAAGTASGRAQAEATQDDAVAGLGDADPGAGTASRSASPAAPAAAAVRQEASPVTSDVTSACG